MPKTNLFEEDMLDLVFENINPSKSPHITASTHTVSGKKEIEILGVNGHDGTPPGQSPTLETVSMIQITVARKNIPNCQPGDVISLTERGKTRDFTISSMNVQHGSDHADLELIERVDPPEEPVIEIHDEYPEVEESALDIDKELGR